MALIPDPGLLILDEPTQGMDVAGRRGFWTAIREDAARGQMIIFRTRLEDAFIARTVSTAAALIRRTGH
jgi:ABC-2 type transport system ATP-binding protein